ncbi:MAG TPA: FapA family protein [Aquabacterium sp.]|nr:FapA family protein [Aquabacterium sp.]
MSSIPGIELVESDGRVLLKHRPVDQRPPVLSDALRVALEQAGWDHWYIDRGILSAAASRCNSDKTEFETVVAERRDARCEIEISRDGMQVVATFSPPYGGDRLAIDDVVQTLAGMGVVFGLDEALLLDVCNEGKSGTFVVAKGQPPVNGEDAKFEVLVNLTRDRTPRIDENGLIDFRELGDIPVVDIGEPLMRRIPPTPGTPGRSVLATLLYPKAGKDEGFAPGSPGVTISETDHNLLCAAVRGQPVQIGHNGMMVEQVIHFNGASMATGNIAFDGTVHIDGDVLTGMKVQATGDVIVTGLVDGGIVEAGQSVLVQGGIIAHAKVKAGESVSARFVENSQVEAGANIGIDDMSLQSDLQAGNQIAVGLKATKRGRLVGGSAKAMMKVSTPLLGDPSSSVTHVMVGVNPVLENEYQDVLQSLDKQSHELQSLTKLVDHLSKLGGKDDMLKRAQATIQQLNESIAGLISRKVKLDEQMSLFNKARVEVGVAVSGSVDLAFGRMTRSLRRPYEAGSFSVEGHLVLFSPQSGDSSEV